MLRRQVFVSLLVSACIAPVMAGETSNQWNLKDKLKFSDKVDVFGSVEVGGGNAKKSPRMDGEGAELSSMSLGATYKPNDKFEISTSVIAAPLEVDEATVKWHALPNAKLDIVAGKKYLPMGNTTETEMISDPLTQQLSEIRRDTVLQASSKQGSFKAKGYVFNGKSSQGSVGGKRKNGYGLGIGYATKTASAGVDYLSNLAESNAIVVKNVAKNVPAVAVHGSLEMGHVTLLGEHLTATQAFQAGDLGGLIHAAIKPSATHLEADIDLQHERTVALAWSKGKHTQD